MAPEDAFQRELLRRELDAVSDCIKLTAKQLALKGIFRSH